MVEEHDGFLEELENEYQQEEVQKLVRMPLRAVLAELGFQNPSRMADEIQIKAIAEEMNPPEFVGG